MLAIIALSLFVSCETGGALSVTEPLMTQAPQIKEGYVKLTPEEALEMMDGEVVILDVRTPEEYNEKHIKYAENLPVDDIEKKAENWYRKDNVILVYCRTGVRSQRAAYELLDMGFKNVYDFGGIVDWTGEFDPQVPEDVITPFEHTVAQRVNEWLPEFYFKLEGELIKSCSIDQSHEGLEERYDYRITKLTITNKNGFKQEFAAQTECFYIGDSVGKMEVSPSFDDWNFDGHMDISIFKHMGGNSGNTPRYYWLWDNAAGKFVENRQLEEMSDLSGVRVNEETKQVERYTKHSIIDHTEMRYKYSYGSFVLVKSIRSTVQDVGTDNEKLHVTVKELINGKMVVTKDYYTKPAKKSQ